MKNKMCGNLIQAYFFWRKETSSIALKKKKQNKPKTNKKKHKIKIKKETYRGRDL